jgi:hypothetical protein
MTPQENSDFKSLLFSRGFASFGELRQWLNQTPGGG